MLREDGATQRCRADGGVQGASVMVSIPSRQVGPRALLAGDAGLLTAAAVGIVLEPGALGDGVPGFLGFIALPW